MFVISFGLSRTMEFFQVEKSNYSLTEFANLAFDMAQFDQSLVSWQRSLQRYSNSCSNS